MATTQQIWRQQNNRLYWEKREKKQRELYMIEEAQQQKELERIYNEMYRWAETEINSFYGKYANAEGIDITEAKKRISQTDIEEYERLAKQYVKDKNFSARANAEMRLYNATMKINRLEMLKARIGLHLVDGINDIDQYYEKVITDRTREEIERQAGILGETVSVADTTKRANNIVNASFFNATYSERIWSHQDRLRSMISIELQRGLIAGIGSREMAQRIKKEFDVSMSDAHRLMVTELRRVQTDVAMDSYKASGIEKYVYMAVNPRACPICREIDGEVYNVADAEPAKNAPPMHPRCHCTTAPYVDEDDYNSWLNYLNQGGSTSDWNKMSLAERQKYANPVVQSTPKNVKKFDPNNINWTPEGKQVKEWCERSGVEYREVKDLPKKLDAKEIITRIAGGDMTQGSCVSLACAYTANKAGWDVLDFRGGSSCRAFALHMNNRKLAKLNGVKSFENVDYSSVKGAQALMSQMEQGKDYMLVTGKHASIVRKTENGYQYLELQSARENGWKDFDTYGSTVKTLQKRFGCTRSRTVYGTKMEQHSYAIEIDSMYESDEFRDLLGYINTAEDKQKKGASGSVK